MSVPQLQTSALRVVSPQGRVLIDGLDLVLETERVAVMGRNGVGKSSLLRVLAGVHPPERGRVRRSCSLFHAPQQIDPAVAMAAYTGTSETRGAAGGLACPRWKRDLDVLGLPEPRAGGDWGVPSHGQARKMLLLAAKWSGAGLLLLDEPTEDLDAAAIAWLRSWLPAWEGAALVVSHDRGLLRTFDDFFVVSESGCRHVHGVFDDVVEGMRAQERRRQETFARQLTTLAQHEQHDERVRRRRARKKNVGRLHELDRSNSRIRLNARRGYAQRSQAKAASIRKDRIEAARAWAKAGRRGLAVELALCVPTVKLGPEPAEPAAWLRGAGVRFGAREVLRDLNLTVGRERLAVTGPNGVGKTTLLRLLRGDLQPSAGIARCHVSRIGSIGQRGEDWMRPESLVEVLGRGRSWDSLAERLAEHRFPWTLAHRPMSMLSPGERVRAALLCLFDRSPEVDVLILDEPTFGLDFVGQAALERVLQNWPGGLIVCSHDDTFLDAVGFEQVLELSPSPKRAAPAGPANDHAVARRIVSPCSNL